MTRAIAFAHSRVAERSAAGLLRSALVSGCALALILAGPALPF